MKKTLVSLIIFVLVFSMFPALTPASNSNTAMERANALIPRIAGAFERRGSQALAETWTGAYAGQPVLVHTPEGEPCYYIVPVNRNAKVVGEIGIDPESGEWMWYTETYSFRKFPPVSALEAEKGAKAYVEETGLTGLLNNPTLMSMPDKHLYWVFPLVETEKVLTKVYVDFVSIETIRTQEDFIENKRTVDDGNFAEYTMPEQEESAQPGGGASTLSVPYHSQTKMYYCGPAALEMVFDYYGANIPQEEIAVAARTDTEYWGTYGDDMRRAGHFSDLSQSQGDDEPISIWGYTARDLGYAAFEDALMSISDLHSLIDEGYPIIPLMWYDASHGGGHFRVVIGYDDTMNEVIVHDPWPTAWGGAWGGPNVHFSETTFNNLWAYSSRWGLCTHPWKVDLSVPKSVAPSSTFWVTAYVTYPCPYPYDLLPPSYLYSATSAKATITVPAGFSLKAGETTTKTLGGGTVNAGDLVAVSWQVVAPATLGGPHTFKVSAEGRVSGSVITHGTNTGYSYTDRIGGEDSNTVTVRTPGTHWDSQKRLGGWSSGYSEAPDVAAWEDSVHMVWVDDPPAGGNPEIYYRRSRDGGTTWDPKMRLSWTSSVSTEPSVAVWGNDVHVVWADNKPGHFEIFYRRSRDGGTTWDPKMRLSWTSEGREPDIATYYYNIGGTIYKWVHVAWEGGVAPNEIYYRKSADGGSTWDGKKKLSWTTGDSSKPSLDAWTDLVAVAWEDEGSGGSPKIFVRVSLSGGAFWEAKRRVSWMAGVQYGPSVAIWGPHVHITWWSVPSFLTARIYYRRNDNYGRPGSWIAPKRLDWFDDLSALPSIDVHGVNNLQLVWTQYRSDLSRYVIFYRSSEDGGDHWAPRKRVTWNTGNSMGASILAWGGVSWAELHMVWQDDTPGNYEIYYKRSHFVASP